MFSTEEKRKSSKNSIASNIKIRYTFERKIRETYKILEIF